VYTWYDDLGDERAGRLDFGSAERPVIAHDNHGNLHALGGSYHIEDTSMARHHYMGHHRGHRKHGKSRHHRGVPRMNPVTSIGPMSAGRFLMTATVVGVGGVAAVELGNLLLNQQTTWTPYQKGAAQIVGGLALGYGAVLAGSPVVAAILGIGGVAFGVDAIYRQWQLDRAIGAMTAPPQTTTGTTGTTGTAGATGTPGVVPGGQALLGSGVPAGYYGVNQGACVGAYR
jgi:hypothetical protein